MIEIKDVSFHIGNFALQNLNLTIQDKEYFVILGPSGAGKTVFMECLAGFHRLKSGKISVGRSDITRIPPEERRLGYVPQDYVLFPFLNVRENIIFGIKRQGLHKIEIQRRMMTLADLLGISHLLERDVRSLSGGEKQRVALARALAPAPQILLLDEPLSSMDVQTAKHLRLELRRIHQELGVTTIHITHNHAEAEEMADRIAVMCAGKIEQVGQPQEIFFSPCNNTVASFVGSLNILEVDSFRHLVPGLIEVDCGGISIIIPQDEGGLKKIAISPRDVYISEILPPGPSVNRYMGAITNLEFTPTTARVAVKIGSNNINAELPADLAKEMDLTPGKEVYVILKLRRLKVMGSQQALAPNQFGWYYQEII